MKIKQYLALFFLLYLFVSCKTLTEPVVYDKTNEKIDKEVELIRYLISNRSFEEAEKRVDENLQLYPNNIDLLHIKAWLYLAKEDYDKSEEFFNNVLKAKAKNPLAMAGLARIYRIKGDAKKALELVNSAISLQPTHSILWFEKGMIEYEQDDFKSAYVDFNKAYNIDIRNYDAYFFKYLSALKMGRDIDEIKGIWFEIEDKRAIKSWYYQYHVEALYEKGELNFALKVAEDGLKYFPRDIYLLNMTAYLLYKKYLDNKDESTIMKAKEYIAICLEKSENLTVEILDTYFSIIEVTENKTFLKKEVEKYYLIYPNSELLIKWIKRIN